MRLPLPLPLSRTERVELRPAGMSTERAIEIAVKVLSENGGRFPRH